VARAEPLATLGRVAALGFSAVVLLLIVVGIPRIFTLLYAARDVELLFTLPIPARGVFLLKFGQSVVEVGGLALLALSVPLLSYGLAAGAKWLYYPVALIVLVSVVVVALGLCHLVDLLLVRVLPARRVKGFMTALSALAGLLGVLGSQFIGNASTRVTTNGLDALPTLPSWLPTSWAAGALTRGARGEAGALLYAGALALVTCVLAGAALTLVERGFRLGWVRLSEGEGRRRGARAERRSARPPSALPGPLVAIGLKELRLLLRDVREWMMVMPFLVIGALTLYRTATAGNDVGDAQASWLLLQLEVLGGFAFFGANFAGGAIAREGDAWWVLRSAPVTGWQVMLGKFWVYWLLPLAGALLLELGLGVGFGWRLSWLALGSSALVALSAGAIGLGLLVGAIGPRYNPERPADRLRLPAMLLLFVLLSVYGGVALLPVGLVIALADNALTRLLSVPWLSLLGAGVAALALRLAASRVDAGVEIGGPNR
jgi:ABC-2 type transport system permease protein